MKSGAPWGTQLVLSLSEGEKLPYREEKSTAEIFAPMVWLCELEFQTNIAVTWNHLTCSEDWAFLSCLLAMMWNTLLVV